MRPSARSRAVEGIVIAILLLIAFFLGCLFSYQHRALSGAELAGTRGPLRSSNVHKKADSRVLVFVGVQTGFTRRGSSDQYNYEKRRAVLRASWFPAPAERAKRAASGVLVQFVIGHSSSAQEEAAIAQEAAEHGDFLRLPLMEGYGGLPNKTLTFLTVVTELHAPEYILKVDDDVYLRLDRVPAAAAQWRRHNGDLVGCMKNGQVFNEPKWRWYEPAHGLLGHHYFTHTWGSVYVLSGRAASLIAAVAGLGPGILRFLSNEDVSLGAWMLALNTTHFDDRRLCEDACSATSLAVYDFPKCAGLCNPLRSLAELHRNEACQRDPYPTPETLPELPEIIVARPQRLKH